MWFLEVARLSIPFSLFKLTFGCIATVSPDDMDVNPNLNCQQCPSIYQNNCNSLTPLPPNDCPTAAEANDRVTRNNALCIERFSCPIGTQPIIFLTDGSSTVLTGPQQLRCEDSPLNFYQTLDGVEVTDVTCQALIIPVTPVVPVTTVAPDNSLCQLCPSIYQNNCNSLVNSICPTASEAADQVTRKSGICVETFLCPTDTIAIVFFPDGSHSVLDGTQQLNCRDSPAVYKTLDGREVTDVTCKGVDNADCAFCPSIYQNNCNGLISDLCPTATAVGDTVTRVNGRCIETFSCPFETEPVVFFPDGTTGVLGTQQLNCFEGDFLYYTVDNFQVTDVTCAAPDNTLCQLCPSIYRDNCNSLVSTDCPTSTEAADQVTRQSGICVETFSCPTGTEATIFLTDGSSQTLTGTQQLNCRDFPSNVYRTLTGIEVTDVTCVATATGTDICENCFSVYQDNCNGLTSSVCPSSVDVGDSVDVVGTQCLETFNCPTTTQAVVFLSGGVSSILTGTQQLVCSGAPGYTFSTLAGQQVTDVTCAAPDNTLCQLCPRIYAENCNGDAAAVFCPTRVDVLDRRRRENGLCFETWTCTSGSTTRLYLADGTITDTMNAGAFEISCGDFPDDQWTTAAGAELTAVTCTL